MYARLELSYLASVCRASSAIRLRRYCMHRKLSHEFGEHSELAGSMEHSGNGMRDFVVDFDFVKAWNRSHPPPSLRSWTSRLQQLSLTLMHVSIRLQQRQPCTLRHFSPHAIIDSASIDLVKLTRVQTISRPRNLDLDGTLLEVCLGIWIASLVP